MYRKIIFPVLIFGVFFLSGCASIYNSATGRQEVYFIDTQAEISLGKDMAKQLSSQMQLVSDPKMQERLDKIGAKISAVSDRQDLKYSFNIVKEKEFNAFAIPGGNVYVNSGLIEAANDDELAAVIAHEVGHIAARHSVKRLQVALGYQLISSIALGASSQGQLSEAVDVVFNVVSLGYSRKDEYLADKLGIRYSKAAGFNPQGMVTFFQKLKAQSKDNGLVLVFLSSHPPIEERIKQANKEIVSLGL